jgi:hypothetical protein
VSRAVGRILAESISQDMSVDPHYYFYMWPGPGWVKDGNK